MSSEAGASQSSPAPPEALQATGAWLELWVPCVIFAHIFATSWLILAFLKMHPQHAATLRRLLLWASCKNDTKECEPIAASAAKPSPPPPATAAAAPLRDEPQPPPAAVALPSPSGPYSQGRLGAAVSHPTAALPAPQLRPGAAEAVSLFAAAAVAAGNSGSGGGGPGRRLWVPPLPSLPPSEPNSAMAQGSAGGSAAAVFRTDDLSSSPQPALVHRRWTAIGIPAADKSAAAGGEVPPELASAAAPSPPVATAAAAASTGVAKADAAAPAAIPAVAGRVQRRTITMHHTVTEADLAKVNGGGATVRPYSDLRSFTLPRSVSRQTREIMSALAAQGAAPDLRVVRRVSSNVRRICIEWLDLGCMYDTSTGPKTVLQGVYGRAVPGDLLGLLGPSGAGKSTLLDVLAARKSVGRLSGQVLVDGKPRDDSAFVRRSAYVPQDDHFIPTLSAWEVISVHAALVLPPAIGPAGSRKRCTEVLAAMGLGRQGSTLVGGTLPGGLVLRGLSGGERKRLAIATGIVAAPSALLLDEPTSGLDAAAALGVMQYMHALAHAGHVVLASVHQPRAAIWSMFTQVVVLSRGRMMYSGDRTGAVPWFTSGLGYCYDPQRHGVASDWIMDLVNTTFKKPRRIYGRMMTTAEDVDAAADAFLRRYTELRDQEKQRDEQYEQDQDVRDEHPPVSYGASAPAEAAAGIRQLAPAGPTAAARPPSGDGLQLYDSLDRARAASIAPTAAATAASPQGLDASPSLQTHRGSTERPSSAIGASRRTPLLAAATAAATAPDGGSVSANAGSPALLPTTPRRSDSFGSGGGAAAAAAAATGGGSGGGTLYRRRPSGPCSPCADHAHINSPFFDPANAGSFDSRISPHAKGHAPPPHHHAQPLRSILRSSHPVLEPPGGTAPAAAPAGITDAAAKAVAAWSGGGGGGGDDDDDEGKQRQRRRQRLWRHQPVQAPGWIRQVRVLTWRELMAMTRNPADVAGRMLIFCWIALVVGLIFYSIGNYFEAIRSRLDVMFIETCVLLLLPYVYMSLYTADKQYYTADLSAKLYSPSAYYVAKVLAVLPFGVLSMLVFSFTIYGMSGLRRDGTALAEHGLLATLAYLIASQVLYAAAVATPNQDTAFMVAIAWTAVNILMSNYLIRYDDMRQIWLTKVLRWFSVMMWAFQGMAAAEYRNQYYSCVSGFGTQVLSTLPHYLPGNPSVRFAGRILSNPGADCAINTNKILSYFNMTEPFWRLAVILLGYLGVLHVLTYMALRLTAGRERR